MQADRWSNVLGFILIMIIFWGLYYLGYKGGIQ